MKLNNQAWPIRSTQCLVVSLLLAWPGWSWGQAIAGTLPVAGQAIAVNPVTNKIYVTSCPSLHSATDGAVVVVDGATNSTRLVIAGLCPRAVAVNPATDRIYVANIGTTMGFGYYSGGSITVIDGSSDSTVTISDPHAPWAVAVNPTTNKIYVANHNSSDVTIIDGNTNAVTTLADPNAVFPVALAVNPLTNKIYVANRGNGGSNAGSVTVIDGATNTTLTVIDPNAVAPNGVAVDTVTNRIYVANEGAYPAPNHGNITVIDGVTNLTSTLTDPDALAPQTVAVNQNTHKIYVANANDSALSGRGPVTVIDGSTNSVVSVTDPNAQNPGAVAVDEVTNTIYVANGGSGGLNPGSNPGSITIINGVTNSTTTLIDPKANGPIAVALNSATNRVYVTNTSANLTVIDGGGIPATHTLGILLAGSGSGAVTSVPAGIDCGISACIASFAAGTPVSLSASAASTSRFTGWQGPCSGAAACNVVTNEDEFVTASFNSTSPVQVVVPSVVGETQAEAATAITNVGLVVGTVTQQSSGTVGAGYTISESPAAGTNVPTGSAVNLVVSTGPAQVAVPNVVGQTQAAATAAITSAGLVVGTVTQQSSNAVASGDVISESPAAGTNVASGSAVNLVASSGSAGGGGYGGGGGLDSIALGALVAALMVRLRKIRPQERAMSWQRKTKFNRPQALQSLAGSVRAATSGPSLRAGSGRWHQWDEFLLSGRPVTRWMPVRGCGFM